MHLRLYESLVKRGIYRPDESDNVGPYLACPCQTQRPGTKQYIPKTSRHSWKISCVKSFFSRAQVFSWFPGSCQLSCFYYWIYFSFEFYRLKPFYCEPLCMKFYIVWHLIGIIIIYRYFSGKLIVSFRLRRFFKFSIWLHYGKRAGYQAG